MEDELRNGDTLRNDESEGYSRINDECIKS